MILASEDDRYPVIQVHNSFIIKDRFRKNKAPPIVLTMHFFCTSCKKSLKLLSTIDHVTTFEPPLMATSLQRPLNFVPADTPYTDWLLLQPVYNGQNNLSTTASFFQRQMEMSRMVMKFHPYGVLMINRRHPILIFFHLYCSGKHKLSTVLTANAVNFSSFVGDSRHELGTLNMLQYLKNCHIKPLPPHNGHLLYDGHFVLSPRWLLWRGLTVLQNAQGS